GARARTSLARPHSASRGPGPRRAADPLGGGGGGGGGRSSFRLPAFRLGDEPAARRMSGDSGLEERRLLRDALVPRVRTPGGEPASHGPRGRRGHLTRERRQPRE